MGKFTLPDVSKEQRNGKSTYPTQKKQLTATFPPLLKLSILPEA